MKFLRHFAALLGVLGIIFALALVWKHTPLASLISNGDRQQSGPGRGQPQFAGGPAGGHVFGFANLDDLAQSIAVLSALIAGVVIIDLRRRDRRRESLTRARAIAQQRIAARAK